MMANSYMACPSRRDRARVAEIDFAANAADRRAVSPLCLKMLGSAADDLRQQPQDLRPRLRARLDVRRRPRPAHLRRRRLRPHRRARAPPRRAPVQPHHPQPAADRAGRDLLQGRAARSSTTIDEAEAAVADVSQKPRGSLHVAAPLGIGKRLIAPLIPAFNDLYPEIDVRLRLSDRRVDMTAEALDMAFLLGTLEDSNLRVRPIADCPRVLCRRPRLPRDPPAPAHRPATSLDQRHACLLHRYPGAREFVWTLATPDGPQRFEVQGPLESDDGDVLTAWALAGRGIILKPAFEIADHLASGALVPVVRGQPAAAGQPRLPLSRTSACRTRRAACSSTSWSPRSGRRLGSYWPGCRSRRSHATRRVKRTPRTDPARRGCCMRSTYSREP